VFLTCALLLCITPLGEVSPRSKYIDSCIRKRLNPRASLILRKNFTKRLNLQHHGMGDDMAVLFAEAIVSVPYIEAINIADNNLTDTGLGPIINAVVHMKDLVDLDISYNTIGPVAASSLSTYLAKESCPLQRLVLRRADVDDGKHYLLCSERCIYLLMRFTSCAAYITC
jgi:hypothetical protein